MNRKISTWRQKKGTSVDNTKRLIGESDTQLKVLMTKLLEHGGWWWLMSAAKSLVGGDSQQV